MPAKFLTDEQAEAYGTFTEAPTRPELERLRTPPTKSTGTAMVRAMVLVLQFAEGLTDRQAAAAVRARIDWKFAPGLELTDPGFDFSVLSEFRDRLVGADAGRRVLDATWTQPRNAGWSRPAERPGRIPRMCFPPRVN